MWDPVMLGSIDVLTEGAIEIIGASGSIEGLGEEF